MHCDSWNVCRTLGVLAAVSLAVTTGLAEEVPERPSEKLERFEPLSPAEAIESMEVAAGYRVELVAAEPLVVDPISVCFDPQGRMIVVEMIDYSERDEDAVGRVRRLTDRSGDGVMDHAETLVERLSWPTAVESWPGGVIVGAPPHLTFFPVEDDEHGNAVVGQPQTWFTGFSRANVQGMMNSFRWGPDLWLHAAASSNRGEISGVTLTEPLNLGRQDFAINPLDRRFAVVPGGAQHGMDFDLWGRKFLTSNSDHLQQALMFPTFAGRASRYSSAPPMRRSIAADGPAADVYRSSPPEPWRLLRTYLRVTGEVPGIVEGGGRAAGYFTGATGTLIYKGDQWPASDDPMALVCDVGGNLVHRKRLEDDGLWKRGVRVDEQTEFVRSSDTWFRPVQLDDGPDGAVYVADMYREIIEHPKSLPPIIKNQVDLNSGNDRGRIWRIVAEDQPLRRRSEPLSIDDIDGLIEHLAHPNHWQRRTAARLLAVAQDASTIGTLRQLVAKAPLASTRLEALAVLELLPDGLNEATLAAALADDHAALRGRALETMLARQQALDAEQLAALADDDSIEVRFRVAAAAAALLEDTSARVQLLSKIAARDPGDPWIRWAVEGSLGDGAWEFLNASQSVLASMARQQRAAWLRSICCQILSGSQSKAVAALASRLPDDEELLAALADEVEGIRPAGTAEPLVQWTRQTMADDLLQAAEAGDSRIAAMAAPMRLVAWADAEVAQRLLTTILSPLHGAKAQQAALVSLVRNDANAAALVIDQLSALTPQSAEVALTTLASRVQGQLAIAKGLDSGKLGADQLPTEVQRTLGESRNSTVKKAAEKHFAASEGPPPGEIYDQYVKALASDADAPAGEPVFRRICANCHAPEEGRQRVGPDLVTVSDQPREQILLAILDPNREVNAKYARVQIVTATGQVLSGIVTDESDTTLTLVDSQGMVATVARQDIEDLQTSPQSLMPEELHKEITPEQMRDLIAYVVSRKPQR